MPIYFPESDLKWWQTKRGNEPLATIHWSVLERAARRATQPGLMDEHATVDWWHLVVEYLSEAALAYRMRPTDQVGRWIVAVVNEISERDEDAWVGPEFRDHTSTPRRGHLETGHVCIAVASALDLAADAFTDAQLQRGREVLNVRGIGLCTRWLDMDGFNNWRCILGAGLAASSVVTGDEAGCRRAVREFQHCLEMFQPDGSHGESSQYSSYAAWGLTVMYESLVRYDASLAEQLSVEPYARCVRWWATNLMYLKPIAGWGDVARPRMVNFNDSGSIAAPHGDVLLHVAARAKGRMPEEAALARWLFDQVYVPTLNVGPFDRASFGFCPRPGFLTPALWRQAHDVAPQSPGQLSMAPLQAFSNGDAVARDCWDGKTILATRGGGEPLHATGHQHADLNSFILAHCHERLLLDPGHSCYRGLLKAHNVATRCHNTCTFTWPNGQTLPALTTQLTGRRRSLVNGTPEPPVTRGGRRLIAQQIDRVTAIASECADVYGHPLRRFARFWLFAAPSVVFVVDHVVADEPLVVNWHWLLNNRDGQLELKFVPPDRLVARRGQVGMKLFHASDNLPTHGGYTLCHAYVHDAYHPRPGQLGEGGPATGQLVGFRQREAKVESLTVHAIALDSYGQIAGWHLRLQDGGIGLEAPGAAEHWTLHPAADAMALYQQSSGCTYRLVDNGDDNWSLQSE